MRTEISVPAAWSVDRIVTRMARQTRTPGDYTVSLTGRAPVAKYQAVVDGFNGRFNDDRQRTNARVIVGGGDPPQVLFRVGEIGPYQYESRYVRREYRNPNW